MKKREFIELAQECGYPRWKDFLVVLGYSLKSLDKFTYEQDISANMVSAVEKWKGSVGGGTEIGGERVNSDDVVEEAVEEAVDGAVADGEELPQKLPKVEVEKKQVVGLFDVGVEVANRDYHNSGKLSASRIKMLIENAYQFYRVYVTGEAKKDYTDALMVGNVHHTLVLEPEKFDSDYIVLGLDGAFKEDLVEAVERLGGVVTREVVKSTGEMAVKESMKVLKEMLNELRVKEPRIIVTKKQVELAETTAKKALGSEYVIEAGGKVLLKARLEDILKMPICHVEKAFYGEIGGVEFQIKPDLLMNLGKNAQIWFCLDLKTAEDATQDGFTKQSGRFFYDVQEWIYREILRQNGIDVVDFRFCVAGKSENSTCAYYKMSEGDIEDAEKIVMRAVQKYVHCKGSGVWSDGGFDFEKMRFDPVTTVQLPAYRKFQLIDMGVL